MFPWVFASIFSLFLIYVAQDSFCKALQFSFYITVQQQYGFCACVLYEHFFSLDLIYLNFTYFESLHTHVYKDTYTPEQRLQTLKSCINNNRLIRQISHDLLPFYNQFNRPNEQNMPAIANMFYYRFSLINTKSQTKEERV